LQNKLDNIRHKVNSVKDNEAHERRESVFATYAAAKMAFTRAISRGPHRKRHGGERCKSQLDFDVDENGGRKKTKNATTYVARAVAITPVVSKARPVAKRAVTIKKKLAKRACTKKSVKKASVKKDSVKKSTPKDNLETTTPVKPIKEPNEMLDTAVAVARSLATTSDAALLAFSAHVTPPAAGCRVAVTCSGLVYTAPDDDTVPIQSESDSEDDDEDVDDNDDNNDVVVQGGVLTPLKHVAMTPPQLVVASLPPVLAQALSDELTDMGVSNILAKPLSPGSAWMGEILESLGTSDSQGERLPNDDITNFVDCRDAVFDRDVDLEALSQEEADHNISAFWEEALDDSVDPFDDPLERREIMEADRMTNLLKRKEEQLRGVETKELDVNFVTKKHADHKQRQVVALMLVLSKEDAPLNELPDMVPNDRYTREHGAKPQFVYNFVHILRGEQTPGKRLLLNISICALVKKWRYEKRKGAKTKADKAYEPSYVAQTIRTLFSWFLDNDIRYKCAEFTGSEL
jgi:hypothetical protein